MPRTIVLIARGNRNTVVCFSPFAVSLLAKMVSDSDLRMLNRGHDRTAMVESIGNSTKGM